MVDSGWCHAGSVFWDMGIEAPALQKLECGSEARREAGALCLLDAAVATLCPRLLPCLPGSSVAKGGPPREGGGCCSPGSGGGCCGQCDGAREEVCVK